MSTSTNEKNGRRNNNSLGPIFILASERSGTNLLRRRLSEWQDIAYGPSPLHLLKHLYYAQPFYGDFSKKTVIDKFINDAIGLAYNHFSPWDISISFQEVLQWLEQHWDAHVTAVSVMNALYTIYAQKKGYYTYICKDNNLFDYCYPIATEIPNSKFIYLSRDPRDAITSHLNRPTQSKSVAKMAMLWRDEQIKSIQAFRSSILKDKRVVSISYEDFVADEEKCIKKICDHIDIEEIQKDKNSYTYQNEKTDIQEWENLNKPTNTSSVHRYKSQLRLYQVRMIEHIAWHQMIYLGYDPEYKTRPNISRKCIELEKVVGSLRSVVSRKLSQNKITHGQKQRQMYIKKLKSTIYI